MNYAKFNRVYVCENCGTKIVQERIGDIDDLGRELLATVKIGEDVTPCHCNNSVVGIARLKRLEK